MAESKGKVQMPREDDRNHKHEPDVLPSQAEGDGSGEPLTPNLRTLGQAEGTREEVDAALREQEKREQKSGKK